MPPLALSITTPERTVLSEEVASVTIPTREGEVTILPHHVPFVGLVVPGALTVRGKEGERFIAVSGGALEVLPGSRCVILTDSADRAEDLVEEEIEAARRRAQDRFEDARDRDAVAFADASAHLERELARLKVARKHRRVR